MRGPFPPAALSARGSSIRLEGVARYQWDCAVTKDGFGGRSCRGRCSRRAPGAAQFGLRASRGISGIARSPKTQRDANAYFNSVDGVAAGDARVVHPRLLNSAWGRQGATLKWLGPRFGSQIIVDAVVGGIARRGLPLGR